MSPTELEILELENQITYLRQQLIDMTSDAYQAEMLINEITELAARIGELSC